MWRDTLNKYIIIIVPASLYSYDVSAHANKLSNIYINTDRQFGKIIFRSIFFKLYKILFEIAVKQ
jgi:hypothetical protein